MVMENRPCIVCQRGSMRTIANTFRKRRGASPLGLEVPASPGPDTLQGMKRDGVDQERRPEEREEGGEGLAQDEGV